MSVWRYEAVDLRDPGHPETRRGEIPGETAADARAALRAAGLEVLRVDILRTRGRTRGSDEDRATDRWLRGRRVRERADLFDALSTLLATGVPLLEGVDTLVASDVSAQGSLRKTLVALRENLRSGESLSDSMAHHPSWFDRSEVAMVEAAQIGGTLAETLRELADRQSKGERLSSRLVSALAYPTVVACVGVLVSAFLATRTLPQLVTVLRSAKLEPPALTLSVIAIGEGFVRWWPAIIGTTFVAVVALAVLLPRLLANATPETRAKFDRALPLVVRRLALARALRRLAELLKSGLPLVESLRVTAPSCRGLATGLAIALRRTASRIEAGEDVADALDAPGWFDPELRRLVAVGEAGGGLEPVLGRIAERHERQADRLVERLASMLEPAAILLLAALVGTVVMAAVLPLVKLQEVI